jgi:hypothetical protein
MNWVIALVSKYSGFAGPGLHGIEGRSIEKEVVTWVTKRKRETRERRAIR